MIDIEGEENQNEGIGCIILLIVFIGVMFLLSFPFLLLKFFC